MLGYFELNINIYKDRGVGIGEKIIRLYEASDGLLHKS